MEQLNKFKQINRQQNSRVGANYSQSTINPINSNKQTNSLPYLDKQGIQRKRAKRGSLPYSDRQGTQKRIEAGGLPYLDRQGVQKRVERGSLPYLDRQEQRRTGYNSPTDSTLRDSSLTRPALDRPLEYGRDIDGQDNLSLSQKLINKKYKAKEVRRQERLPRHRVHWDKEKNKKLEIADLRKEQSGPRIDSDQVEKKPDFNSNFNLRKL